MNIRIMLQNGKDVWVEVKSGWYSSAENTVTLWDVSEATRYVLEGFIREHKLLAVDARGYGSTDDDLLCLEIKIVPETLKYVAFFDKD